MWRSARVPWATTGRSPPAVAARRRCGRPVGTTTTPVELGCGTRTVPVLLAAQVAGVGLEPDQRTSAVARRNLVPYPDWRVGVVGEDRQRAEAEATFASCARPRCGAGWIPAGP